MSTHSAGNSSEEQDLVQAAYGFALSLTHHPQEAEDVVQQACFRVISKKGRLHSRSYLFKVVRNLFYDLERRKKLVPFESINDLDAPAADTPGIEIQMDLETELDRLEPEERAVVFLNCVEGYTAAELAKLMEKPRSTILNILSRAKAKLAAARSREDSAFGS